MKPLLNDCFLFYQGKTDLPDFGRYVEIFPDRHTSFRPADCFYRFHGFSILPTGRRPHLFCNLFSGNDKAAMRMIAAVHHRHCCIDIAASISPTVRTRPEERIVPLPSPRHRDITETNVFCSRMPPAHHHLCLPETYSVFQLQSPAISLHRRHHLHVPLASDCALHANSWRE